MKPTDLATAVADKWLEIPPFVRSQDPRGTLIATITEVAAQPERSDGYTRCPNCGYDWYVSGAATSEPGLPPVDFVLTENGWKPKETRGPRGEPQGVSANVH